MFLHLLIECDVHYLVVLCAESRGQCHFLSKALGFLRHHQRILKLKVEFLALPIRYIQR
ncbi:unnamed protein product, partial [Nesidiocoris tenuis]